jgi:hypothetical protein
MHENIYRDNLDKFQDNGDIKDFKGDGLENDFAPKYQEIRQELIEEFDKEIKRDERISQLERDIKILNNTVHCYAAQLGALDSYVHARFNLTKEFIDHMHKSFQRTMVTMMACFGVCFTAQLINIAIGIWG